MSENILEIRHLGKSFGTHEVLRDIDNYIIHMIYLLPLFHVVCLFSALHGI